MRLIDAHKLYEQYEADMCELVKSTNCENISLEALSLLCGAKIIADAPTIDAIPVKHGRWGDYGHCSCCGWGWSDLVYDRTEQMSHMNYCPCCGACMDLEEQDAKEKN